MRAEVVDGVLVGTNPLSNIPSVRKRHTETNNAHLVFGLKSNVVHARNNHFVHISTVAAEHVELVGDEQLHCLDVLAALPLAGQHIPLSRSGKDKISLLEQFQIGCGFACQLDNRLASVQSTEALLPISKSEVDQLLEGSEVNCTTALSGGPVPEQGQLSANGLATSCRGTDEDIIIGVED